MMQTRERVITAAISLAAALGVRAATNTWQGVNTAYLAGMLNPGDDLTTYQSAGDAANWSLGVVPGPGDTADFNFNTGSTYVWGDVLLDGAFNPDHIIQRVNGGPLEPDQARVHLLKDLTVESLTINYGNTSAGQGDRVFYIPPGITLTLTGKRPLSLLGKRGAWGSVETAGSAKLEFAGADQTFDSFNRNAPLAGGASATVDVSRASASLMLGDPGVNVTASIFLGEQTLRVRSDQTWLNPARTGWVSRRVGANGQFLLHSLDGAPLHNLSNVAFRVEMGATANNTYYIPEGTYQSLHLRSSLGYGRAITYRFAGEVELAGGVVVPGNGTDVSAKEIADSLRIVGSNASGANTYLQGHDLTALRGIYLYQEGAASPASAAARFYAGGSTLNIGGDLTYHSSKYQAGTTNSAGALEECRVAGILGDADTVVNLHGRFLTDVRSPSGSGLAASTVNLLGGAVDSPTTFEVGCDPADLPGASSTYAIGQLRIGATGPAHVRLVNENLNDNDPANPLKTREGEILVAGTLDVAAGSTLDLNGHGVKIGTSLNVGPAAWLDLNVAGELAHGDLVPGFVGIANQVAEWNVFADRVRDSSQPNLRFEAVSTSMISTPVGATSVLELDGVNDLVELPADGLGTASITALTVELWLRIDSVPGGWGYAMHRGIDKNIGSSVYWLGVNSNSGNLGAAVNGNYAAGETGIPADAAWHHLALTYDGAVQKVYVDGIEKASATVGAISNARTGTRIGIGSSPNDSAYRPIGGNIAEARVWNYARSGAEIQAAMSSQLAGDETGLVGYWPMDDGSPVTVADRSASSNDGTLKNGLAWEGGDTYWKVIGAPLGTLLLVQ